MTRSSCCAGQLLDDWWSGFYKAVFEAKHKYKGKETTSSSAISCRSGGGGGGYDFLDTLHLCERWRESGERSKSGLRLVRRVHAAQRLSRDHSPSRSRRLSRSPNSRRSSSVSGSDQG